VIEAREPANGIPLGGAWTGLRSKRISGDEAEVWVKQGRFSLHIILLCAAGEARQRCPSIPRQVRRISCGISLGFQPLAASLA